MIWFYFTLVCIAIVLVGVICKGVMPKLTKSFNNILIDFGGIGAVIYGMLFAMWFLG